MKKTLVFLVAVVVAAVSQAATVSWSSGKMYVPLADGSLSTTAAKATVNVALYLVSEDVFNSYKNASSLDIYNASATIASSALETKTGKTASLSSVSKITTATEFNKGDYAYAIAIYTTTVDGTDYVIAKAGHDMINDTGAQANLGSGNLGIGNWSVVTPVPEPTTVALLALGLAAIGLKRKVA